MNPDYLTGADFRSYLDTANATHVSTYLRTVAVDRMTAHIKAEHPFPEGHTDVDGIWYDAALTDEAVATIDEDTGGHGAASLRVALAYGDISGL